MPKKLSEQIKNKPAKERAKLKGIEIAQKLIPNTEKIKAKNNKQSYNFEIVDVKAIEKGVEVYARVFEKGEQIGFGKDGSVDIERFIFMNPPVLVDDEKGDIIREWEEETGELKQRKLKEDPQEAILQALEHTISVKKQKFDDKNIVKGKIGNTTSTFYPDANPESDTVDGYVRIRNGDNWNSTHDSATANQYSGASTSCSPHWEAPGPLHQSDGKWNLSRTIYLFDTSAIPSSDEIDSATFSIYENNTSTDDENDDYSYYTVVQTQGQNMGSDTSLTADDYNDVGDAIDNPTKGSQDIDATTVANNNNQYHNFTLNTSGKSWIAKNGEASPSGATNGITYLGLREGHDIEDVEPDLSSDDSSTRFGHYFADETGTAKDPKLVVEHSPPITAYTATLTESITLSQATTREVNYSKSYTDSVSLTDTVATKNGFFKGLVDTLSLNGIQSTLLGFKKVLTDTISLVDSVKTTILDKLVLTEVISLSDIVDKSYKASVKLKDTLTLTGNLIVGAVHLVQHLIDKISLSDTQTRVAKYAKSFTETITLTGSVTKKMIAHITDSITLTSKRVKIGVSKILTDSISLTDTMSRSTKFIKPLVDSVKVSGKIVKRGWTYAVKNVTNWTWGNKKDQ